MSQCVWNYADSDLSIRNTSAAFVMDLDRFYTVTNPTTSNPVSNEITKSEDYLTKPTS